MYRMIFWVKLGDQSQENDFYEIFQPALKRPCFECKIISPNSGFRGRSHISTDLSASFHTIGHQKPLDLLSYLFGIRGDALMWLKPIPQAMTQTIQIGSGIS